ncbi:putative immune type receptor [Triplophysa rosa]|uniref:Immune type receptor n=1 Tax=Triplophysa rosa TaxID=992332 RepID=A0A9W7T7N1_TRIRA|nr:putative immune type receptor [Triplophysa rosa]
MFLIITNLPVMVLKGMTADTDVFISSGESESLSCNDTLHQCSSTSWIFNHYRTSTVEVFAGGIKKNNTERSERMSLTSDCSLNIYNTTQHDRGVYTCRQYVNGHHHGTESQVYLHVLHDVCSNTRMTSRPQSHILSDLQVRHHFRRLSVITSDVAVNSAKLNYIFIASVKSTTTTRVILVIVEVSVFAAPTVILLQIICARRAHNRRRTQNAPQEDQEGISTHLQ